MKQSKAHNPASWSWCRMGGALMAATISLVSAVALLSCGGETAAPPQPVPHTEHGAASSAPAGAVVEPSPAPAITPQIPPFHASEAEAKPFPETLSPSLFRDPVVAQAYRIAKRIPGVLAQQPCYCYCDRFGHGSLLDCYRDDHGAG